MEAGTKDAGSGCGPDTRRASRPGTGDAGEPPGIPWALRCGSREAPWCCVDARHCWRTEEWNEARSSAVPVSDGTTRNRRRYPANSRARIPYSSVPLRELLVNRALRRLGCRRRRGARHERVLIFGHDALEERRSPSDTVIVMSSAQDHDPLSCAPVDLRRGWSVIPLVHEAARTVEDDARIADCLYDGRRRRSNSVGRKEGEIMKAFDSRHRGSRQEWQCGRAASSRDVLPVPVWRVGLHESGSLRLRHRRPDRVSRAR